MRRTRLTLRGARRLALALGALVLLVASPAEAGARGGDDRPPGNAIRVRGVSGDTVVTLLPTESGGLVRLDVMARLLGGGLDSAAGGRWRLTLYSTVLDLRTGSPFIAYNGFVVPMHESLRVHENAPFVPLQLFSEIVPRFGIGIVWDRPRAEVRLFQGLARNAPGPRGTTVAAQSAATAEAVSAPVRPASTESPPTARPASAVPSTPRVTPAASTARAADAPTGLARRYTIAIDAGHGGVDPGNPGVVIGGRRINESRLTLAMAQRVERELKQRGLDVVMTRSRDTLIARDDRGPIANARRADLFISLHTNAANPSWRNGQRVRGVETYFLATARTEDERRVAAMENDVVRFETQTDPDKGDPLSFILNDLAQNEHLRESADLAELVQARLAARHPGTNRGVKQAGFAVLARAFMPAILVEVGFGTNVEDAAWMASVEGQRDIAQSITDAVIEYLQHYERRTRQATP